MYRTSSDRRFYKIKKDIRAAFVKLVLEKDHFTDISITEVSDLADINRKTFYLHYDSLEDILTEYADDLSEDLMQKEEKWTAPLYVLFFVVSGAELELGVFSDIAVVGIGVVYILFRSLGKYFGAYSSCKAVGCDEKAVPAFGQIGRHGVVGAFLPPVVHFLEILDHALYRRGQDRLV